MFNQGIHYSGGWDIMFNYEELFVATMVARGFAIVMTDYEGSVPRRCPLMWAASPRVRPFSMPPARPCGYLEHRWIRMARGVLGLLAGRRGGGIGRRAGVVVRPELHIVGTYAGAPWPT
ncbi:putative hydrolase [Mycobacterium xenopi 3993]|nr:putative hydrolase [Mycobacterium xenopi 3993]